MRQDSLGRVSLVGAGPGDAELITVRGLRRLQAADAVVYDRLVAPELLEDCRPDAERFDVGKAPGCHARRQPEINRLLVELGQTGRHVVRLKGGDPFLFGRGGEEGLALAAAGVPYEVIPGVSSALAAPAAAGIPVTHRGLAQSVTVATGHAQADGPDVDHDWEAFARLRGTLVFLMAVERLEHIADALIRHGRACDEPAALVRWGATHQQTVATATLGTIAAVARERGIRPPAVLVIGPTVPLGTLLYTEAHLPAHVG